MFSILNLNHKVKNYILPGSGKILKCSLLSATNSTFFSHNMLKMLRLLDQNYLLIDLTLYLT
jgi:hypothetical protein